jgi:hypothetical protein
MSMSMTGPPDQRRDAALGTPRERRLVLRGTVVRFGDRVNDGWPRWPKRIGKGPHIPEENMMAA